MPDQYLNTSLHELMSRYQSGQDDVGEALCARLQPSLSQVVDSFLGWHDADRDDLVQEALMALLSYLRGGGSLPENPTSFAATIIRNRCRNLYRWRKKRPTSEIENMENRFKSPEQSPLDLLLEDEVLEGLKTALRILDSVCSDLLRGIYLEHRSMEHLSRQLGLASVQAVYYRRNQCLDKIKKIFEKTGFGCPVPVTPGSEAGRRKDGTDHD